MTEPTPEGEEPAADQDPQPDARRRTSSLRQAMSLLEGQRWLALALAAIAVPAGFCESAVLVLVAEVAGALVGRQGRVSVSAGPLRVSGSPGHVLTLAAILALVRIALQFPVAYLPARILADGQAQLRRRLFSAFTRAPWPIKSEEQEGQFQELVTSQVIQAMGIIGIGLQMVVTIASLVVLLVTALIIGLVPALVVLGAGVALFALLRPLGALGSRRATALSDAQVDYATAVGEATRLAEEAQVFGAGGALESRVGRLVEAIRRRSQVTSFLGGLVPGIYYGMVLLLLVGGLSLILASGAGRLVSLGAAILLLVRAANYGQQTQGAYQNWRQSAPFLARLGQTEQRYRRAAVPRGQRQLAMTPVLRFEHVSYSYVRDAPVLEDLSFEVRAGEAIGIVGPTGAGKSTLVQLILALREPTSGRYLVDGELAGTISESGLARAFAYVSQEPRLLHATVADNIDFFRGLDREAIEEAARLAHIDRDIRSWSQGYDTLIGQRADAISGGQRQRICLARALAGKPFVLVLDEPTSSLDIQSESLVGESLAALKGQLTVFVVAHRLATTAFCDRVMVIVDGRLEAFSAAQELREVDGFYRRSADLHATQASGPGS